MPWGVAYFSLFKEGLVYVPGWLALELLEGEPGAFSSRLFPFRGYIGDDHY
jgi:hypothetical protein